MIYLQFTHIGYEHVPAGVSQRCKVRGFRVPDILWLQDVFCPMSPECSARMILSAACCNSRKFFVANDVRKLLGKLLNFIGKMLEIN